MNRKILGSILLGAAAALFLSQAAVVRADDAEAPVSILADTTGDGLVNIGAFGDSITRGEGDFTSPDSHVDMSNSIAGAREAGYPLRVESLLGVNVDNWGSPGESLLEGGLERFIHDVTQLRPDIVVIMEGVNDSLQRRSAGSIYRAYQIMVNVARAMGTTPVVATILPTCCNHAGELPIVRSYDEQIRVLAAVNEVRLVDGYHAFANTCTLGSCRLLNRPEGLHPNIEGYDVLGETVISALLGIDLFAPDGPTLLAQALNVDPTSIRTVPDPLPTATPTP